MTSVVRAPSQIPANGTYRATADLSGTVFTIAGANQPTAVTAGTILYDMGKTVYLPAADANKTQVLRRVQVAPFESNVAFETFYIKIGGTGTATPVARL